MTWTVFLGFLIAILPVALTPGASLTLATQRSLAGERAATGWVIAGTATGIYAHATLAGLGLSALVMRSAEVFTAVKLVGAAYLIGLGAVSLWRSRRRRATSVPRRSLPWVGHHTFPQALLSNVLNPKAAAVYLTLAPQFLSAGHVGVGALLALATVHVLVMATWLGVWGVALSGARRIITMQGLKAWINRVGGAVLVALGVRAAATAWSR
ncbi:MAG: LysE family translocator [Actinocatenispora sp.]